MKQEQLALKNGTVLNIIYPTKKEYLARQKHIKEQEFDFFWESIQTGTIKFSNKKMKKINVLLKKIQDKPEKYITSYDEICTSMLKKLHFTLQRIVFGKLINRNVRF